MGDLSPVMQACAIPFRVNASGRVQILLITTRSGRWSLPKGHVEGGWDGPETARIEALEEAGAEGTTVGGCVGSYSYVKAGRRRRVEVYPLRVERLLRRWDEQDFRQRRWVSVPEALQLVHNDALATLLRRLFRRHPEVLSRAG